MNSEKSQEPHYPELPPEEHEHTYHYLIAPSGQVFRGCACGVSALLFVPNDARWNSGYRVLWVATEEYQND